MEENRKIRRRFTIEDVSNWAEEYKKTLSFESVSKKFNVRYLAIMNGFRKYKKISNIVLKNEIKEESSPIKEIMCPKCKDVKNISCFGFSKTGMIKKKCKECVVLEEKEYNESHKKERKERDSQNKEHIKEVRQKYNKEHVDKIRQYEKEHKDIRNERRRNNKGKRREYQRMKMETDINYKISEQLRGRLTCALKGNFKTGSAVRDLGCSIDEFKLYFESKFYPNPETGEMMTWDNYGLHGWHIDHIIPLVSFDLTDREQLLKAVNYTNLQPLWAKENLSKGATIQEITNV